MKNNSMQFNSIHHIYHHLKNTVKPNAKQKEMEEVQGEAKGWKSCNPHPRYKTSKPHVVR